MSPGEYQKQIKREERRKYSSILIKQQKHPIISGNFAQIIGGN